VADPDLEINNSKTNNKNQQNRYSKRQYGVKIIAKKNYKTSNITKYVSNLTWHLTVSKNYRE